MCVYRGIFVHRQKRKKQKNVHPFIIMEAKKKETCFLYSNKKNLHRIAKEMTILSQFISYPDDIISFLAQQ